MRYAATLIVLAVAIMQPAIASVVDFTDPYGTGSGDSIADGYAGFHWDTMSARAGVIPNSGYETAILLGGWVAFNGLGHDAEISSDTTFDFNGAYFNAAWRNGLHVLLTGYSGSQVVDSLEFIVDYDEQVWVQADFAGIDRLILSSFGGVEAGLSDSGFHFVMDNFTYNETTAVPLPPAFWLLISGMATLLLGSKPSHRKSWPGR